MGAKREEEPMFIRLLEQKIDSLEKLGDERWKAHEEVHKQGQRTMDASFAANQEKLSTMNEFREQQNKERADFVRLEVYSSEHKALEAKLDSKNEANEKRFGIIEGIQNKQAGKSAAYVSVVGILSILLQVFLHFVWK